MTQPGGAVVVGIGAAAPATAAAIAYGGWEAARHRVGLHLVYAYGTSPPWLLTDADGAPPSTATRALDHHVEAAAKAHPDISVTGTVHSGSPASALVSASSSAILVIVVADARIHYGGLLAGLVSIQVAGHALTSVLIVPEPAPRANPGEKPVVVVGVDGSSGSGVAFAFDEARARGAVVHAIHVLEPLPGAVERRVFRPVTEVGPDEAAADRMLRAATAPWEDSYPDVTVVRSVIHGDNPVRALNDAAAGADLIVVGPRGHGGFATLAMGSTSDGLVRYSRHNVAIVRAGGGQQR